MAGRGGRGAAIMEALLARQREVSERSGSETADEEVGAHFEYYMQMNFLKF